MRKFYFFLAAMCCAVMSLMPQQAKAEVQVTEGTAIDSIDAPRYITEMTFDPKTYELRFKDIYKPKDAMDREYEIHVYYRNDKTSLYSHMPWMEGGQWVKSWGYGFPDTERQTEITNGRKVYYTDVYKDSYGGYVNTANLNFPLTELLKMAISAGHSRLRICVDPQFQFINNKGLTISRSYYLAEGEREKNKWLNNYINVNLVGVFENTLIAPKKVDFGDFFELESTIMATREAKYKIQESSDGKKWHTLLSDKLSSVDARKGKTKSFEMQFDESIVDSVRYYRQIATDVSSGKADTSEVQKIEFRYKLYWLYNGAVLLTSTKRVGEVIHADAATDCMELAVTSALPVEQEEKDGVVYFTMPACNVTIDRRDITYTVKFLNGDYSELDVQEVKCGKDAKAPENPTLGDMKFRGWSKDFTNVHKNLTVVAQYDMGEDFYFYDKMISHTNKLYPHKGFEGSDKRAMVGDSLTFRVEIRMPTEASLYYQRAWLDAEGEWHWGDPLKIGDYSTALATEGEAKMFTQSVAVAYENYNEMAFRYGEAFRFNVYCAGATVMSDPYEFDVYYETGIQCAKEIHALNKFGDQGSGTDFVIPARYKDTIQVQMKNGSGPCLRFARTIKSDPKYMVETGLTKQGKAYFVGPGEKETMQVTTTRYAVVFDGVHGSQTKEYDFSEEGLGKFPHAYYAEIVDCGGSIATVPEDPVWDGRIFLGWKNESFDEYADDAYMQVPAIDGTFLVFTAQWDDIPEVPEYTVRFFGKDGAPQIGEDQKVKEGDNATPPDAPTVEGWHFAGWDKPYNMIMADVDITALYGDDSKTWKVKYLNWDDSELGEEEVADAMGAIGVTATREKGVFDHWENTATGKPADLEHVYSDLTVKAVFAGEFYNVTFRVEGEETYKTSVAVDTKFEDIVYPKDTPTKEETDDKTFTFKGWTPEVATITEDVVFDAVFDEKVRTFTVIFQNWDHTELSKQTVEYGQAAIEPETPERPGNYVFSMWDNNFEYIICDMTITAVFYYASTSGICGPKLTWVYDDATFSLKISGEGDMFDYNYEEDPAQWFMLAVNKKIKQIEMPEGMTSIGNFAFAACSMSSVTIPKNVTKIGWGGLYYCENLTTITVPENVEMIGDIAFASCMNLQKVTLPDKVKRIEFGTFMACPKLYYIKMPQDLYFIGVDAFSHCESLQKITLPAGVTTIDNYAFDDSKLTEIHCFAATPPTLGKKVFEKTDKPNCKLYVLKESIEAYKAAEEWKEFDIQEETGTTTGFDQDPMTNDQLPMTNKLLINGRLYILNADHIYDATGRLVK